MVPTKRRAVLAAALTLPVALAPRKPWAATPGLSDLSRLQSVDGATVPEFRFSTADGTVRTLADYAGQGVVLNLWATWCVPCVAEMPALDALARLVAGDGVAVLALSSDRGGAPPVERFYRDKKIQTLPVLLDPRGDAARALGARGIPTTLLRRVRAGNPPHGRPGDSLPGQAGARVERLIRRPLPQEIP